MTEKNIQLLELINQGKTINEICTLMKLSYKQLSIRLHQLKKWGIQFERKYYYDGESTYYVSKDIKSKEQAEVSIITGKSDEHFKAILISDLHIGNENERIDSLEKIYDYAVKENIHIVLNTGDIIDGTIGTSKKHKTILEQIEYALKVYPYDKNILNFICLGNHDASSKENCGFDFGEIIKNNRLDLIPIGYGMGTVHVKNDNIILRHHLNNSTDQIPSRGLFLNGHTHTTRFVESGLSYHFYLPTLSGLDVKKEWFYPCAFMMDLQMHAGYFIQGVFNQLLVDSRVYVVNEFVYDLCRGKSISNNSIINNEEERKIFIKASEDAVEESEQIKKNGEHAPELVKKTKSQIDKFHQRYGYKKL